MDDPHFDWSLLSDPPIELYFSVPDAHERVSTKFPAIAILHLSGICGFAQHCVEKSNRLALSGIYGLNTPVFAILFVFREMQALNISTAVGRAFNPPRLALRCN